MEYYELAREAELTRQKCPDCPDGQLWDSNGPTDLPCLTCEGTAFVWAKKEPRDER